MTDQTSAMLAEEKLYSADDCPVFDAFAAHLQSQTVEIAIRIGLFEALKQPQTLKSLAERLAIAERAAEALVSVLCASGLLDLCDGIASLRDVSHEYLLRKSPFFMGALFCQLSNEEVTMFQNVHLQNGMPRPETTRWLGKRVADPAKQAERMHAHTFAAATSFACEPIFSSIANLLDVGGGAGTVSIALAQKNRNMHCTVLDLPSMRPVAASLITKYGMNDRVRFVACDMFNESWASGNDAALFSNIFHDWDRSRCVSLARKAYDALPPGGHIFVNEMLMNDRRTGPLGVALFDWLMLLLMEGKQFTFPELAGLLEECRFVECRRLAAFGYYSLVSACKL